MDLRLTEEQQSWVDEVRAFLRETVTPDLREELWEYGEGERKERTRAFFKQMAHRGWFGVTLPEEYGGLGRSAVDFYLMVDEFEYWGLPRPDMTVMSVVPALARVGTPEQKAYWIPKALSGDFEFALGYSEPNAGSDLASLRTRAVLDGDEWVINGQKIWNTGAHRATHEWLAVRTDPEAPKHRGISVIMVPIDSPGVTVRPLWTWPGIRTNEIFFENVRVPRENLIGEVNQGWRYIGLALDFERLAVGTTGSIRRIYEHLVDYVKQTAQDGRALSQDPIVRYRLARLRVDLEMSRLLAFRTADLIDREGAAHAESSEVKIFGSELRARVADAGMQLLDLYGQLDKHDRLAPFRGELEDLYRTTPYLRFGGGTNEIQRDIVAQQGFGLPRSR